MTGLPGYKAFRDAARSAEMSVGLDKFYLRRTKGAVVLAYHGVAPREAIVDDWVQSVHIDPLILKRQLEFISRRFDVVEAIDEDQLARAATKRPVALITFDDGYKNFLTHGLPILDSVGLPSTLFVTANCIENGSRHPVYLCRAAIANLEPGSYDLDSIGENIWISESSRANTGRLISDRMKRMPWEQAQELIAELQSLFGMTDLERIDEKYSTDEPLSWEELRMVKDRGVTVGSHTLDHVVLSAAQSTEVVRSQVIDSRRLIAERLGECRLFAYPNGSAPDVSQTAVTAVSDAGYAQAFTTVPGVVRTNALSASRFVLPRLAVGDNWNGFRKYVTTAWRHNHRHSAMADALVGTA